MQRRTSLFGCGGGAKGEGDRIVSRRATCGGPCACVRVQRGRGGGVGLFCGAIPARALSRGAGNRREIGRGGRRCRRPRDGGFAVCEFVWIARGGRRKKVALRL